MTQFQWRLIQMPSEGDMEARGASLSSALAVIFRGKLCDVVLRNRPVSTIEKDQVLYNVGDKDQTLFFLRSGFVKVGTITRDGHELIYDVRKGGDVVGELCASENPRQDRAVALEQTQAIAVPFDEVLEIVQKNRDLLRQLVQVFCDSLSDAYDQLNSLAFSDTVHRLIRVLVRLGTELGRGSGQRTELSTYLTQEEISQMVAVRRERVSTAMNFLRNRGMVDYSQHGYLTLDLKALQNYGD
jgi:CRP/FNR family transcriptional regulator, cyclic AMP receptor protein